MKTLSIPDGFDGSLFESLSGYPASSIGDGTINNVPTEWENLDNCVNNSIPIDWAVLRSSLYLSSEWYRVKTASIESAAIASELWHLFWNYDRYPEIGAEIVSTIAALKIVSSPTVEEKNAIAQIMKDCHIPELIVTAVEA